jgi:hypothetical protein
MRICAEARPKGVQRTVANPEEIALQPPKMRFAA